MCNGLQAKLNKIKTTHHCNVCFLQVYKSPLTPTICPWTNQAADTYPYCSINPNNWGIYAQKSFLAVSLHIEKVPPERSQTYNQKHQRKVT